VEKKPEVYKWIKIAGLVSFLPFVLVVGPVGGYFIGDYLQKRFSLNRYFTLIIIAVGFIFSLRETVRIIKLVIFIDRKS
jgi:hypothetical protein